MKYTKPRNVDRGTVAGYDYGEEAAAERVSGLAGSETVTPAPAGRVGQTPGSTLSVSPAAPRAKTKSSNRAHRPLAASDVPLPDPDSLPGVPEKPAKVAKAFEAAARKTAYQIYEELNTSRSLEGVANNGGFDLEDVKRWAEEDRWEEHFQEDRREIEHLAISEGNPTQAIRLRAAMKVDCLHALERDIACTDSKYALKQTERKAIFDMVKELTDSEIGTDKMRPGKIIVLMDKEAYAKAAMSRKEQLTEQLDEKVYDKMVEQYLPKKGEVNDGGLSTGTK